MTSFKKNYSENVLEKEYGYENNIISSFAETDIFFSKKTSYKGRI